MAVKHRETARHKEAFEVFYSADRDLRKVAAHCAVSERTAEYWADWFGWRALADRRDREAAARAEREAVRRRAAMLTRQREAGDLLIRRGTEWLEASGLESDRSAISAIKTGIDVARQAEGLPDYVAVILNADDAELDRLERELDARRRAAALVGETPEAGAAPVGVGANGHA